MLNLKKTDKQESAVTVAGTVESVANPNKPLVRPGWLRWAAGGLAVILLAAFPFIKSEDTYAINLLTQTLILALFASSLNLIMGYTGLTSFGHAVFFGVGGMSVGVMITRWHFPNFWLGLLLAFVLAGVVALVLGFFSIRTSGVYFFMLTLAFAEMFRTVVSQWDYTGSSDGMSAVRPEFNLLGLNFKEQIPFYLLVLVLFLAGFFILRKIVRAPFGQALVGIRDNEERMAALGYQTRNFKLVAFVVSGAIAGVAGALNVYFNGYVGSNSFDWGTSGAVMIMVLLGGKGTMIGPVVGAFFVNYLQSFLSSRTEKIGTFVFADRWLMVLGLIFIVFVLVAPNGLIGLWTTLSGRVKKWASKR